MWPHYNDSERDMAPQAFFDGVLTLARASGADRGRVLLRAATELFVETPQHTRAEIAVFEELVLQLLKIAPVEDRRAVAELLAERADVPAGVVRALLHDELAVAEVLLTRTPNLGEVDLLAVIATGTDGHLERIAERAHLPEVVVEALVRNLRVEALPILLANTSVRIPEAAKPRVMDVARENPTVARALSRRHEDFEDTELTELFLDLDSRGRRRVIQSLEILALRDFAARRPMPPKPVPAPEIVEELNRTALSRDVGAMAGRLAELLRIDRAMARALLTDAGGEPLAIALKAAGLSEPLATRVILFSGASDSRNYAEVKRLVELFESVSLRSALLLAAHWRGEDVILPRRGGHQHLLQEGTPVRAAQPKPVPAAVESLPLQKRA